MCDINSEDPNETDNYMPISTMDDRKDSVEIRTYVKKQIKKEVRTNEKHLNVKTKIWKKKILRSKAYVKNLMIVNEDVVLIL